MIESRHDTIEYSEDFTNEVLTTAQQNAADQLRDSKVASFFSEFHHLSTAQRLEVASALILDQDVNAYMIAYIANNIACDVPFGDSVTIHTAINKAAEQYAYDAVDDDNVFWDED